MTEKIVKTPVQVATQLKRQFLKFYIKDKQDLFMLFSYEKHGEILNRTSLDPFEIPVLILITCDDTYIINTTTRFIRIGPSSCEFLYYTDFKHHEGYKSWITEDKKVIKLGGAFGEFGLKKINGELIYWKIPTGKPGCGFWNITNRCSIIGRRILIIP
jgi:hypothetical protein